MKMLSAIITATIILTLPPQLFAAKGGEKGPSDQAYERASDNASFRREGGKVNKGKHYRDDRYSHDSDSERDHDRDGRRKHDREQDSRDHDRDDRRDRDREQNSEETLDTERKSGFRWPWQ